LLPGKPVWLTDGRSGAITSTIELEAIKGYKMTLIMPDNMTAERVAAMQAYGAEIILTPASGSMEAAIDLAREMELAGKGKILDQFSNPDNPRAHYETTGVEIWRDTKGTITHFVSAMGTTGTIMGTSKYLTEQNSNIQIVGVQPQGDSKIAGIRRWTPEYLPKIYDPTRVNQIIEVDQLSAENMTRRLAKEEGVFAGVSSGGAVFAALKLANEVENAVIVTIICDRGDRYLSTGLFNEVNV
jgi:cysteine synthase B